MDISGTRISAFISNRYLLPQQNMHFVIINNVIRLSASLGHLYTSVNPHSRSTQRIRIRLGVRLCTNTQNFCSFLRTVSSDIVTPY